MSLRKQLAMMVIGAGVLTAQKEPPKQCEPPPGSVRKILQVQNRRAGGVAQLAKGLGLCVAHDGSRLVAVSGPAAGVQALEESLKRTDASPKEREVEFIGYILLASNESSGTEPVPATLDAVVQQLRSVFPYKSYGLLDTLMARQSGDSYRQVEIRSNLPMLRAATEGNPRGTTGETNFQPMPKALTERNPRGASCEMRFQIGPVPNEAGGRIPFEQLHLVINESDGNAVVITTSFSIRDGQKVVIGKANSARPNQTFFLVASARLVD